MEEIIQLLRENNYMLKFICRDIINNEKNRDTRDIANNIIGDWMAEFIMNRNT